MSLMRPEPKFDWFIPIDGDGAHIGTVRAERPPTFEYLRQVVETAERNGFHSLLIPTRFANGLFEEKAPLAETWTTVTALTAVTSHIRFLIAIRPGFISPGLFAQMAATLDQISGGRIDLNVVPGGIQGDFERFGETSDHANRYERAEEFIAALRALWREARPGGLRRSGSSTCVALWYRPASSTAGRSSTWAARPTAPLTSRASSPTYISPGYFPRTR